MTGDILRQSYEHLACLAAVLQQPCVSCGCRTSFRKRKQITKKMNMSKIRCGSLATLFFVRQSCGVVHNSVRLPYETKKFFVADGCTAVARQCETGLTNFTKGKETLKIIGVFSVFEFQEYIRITCPCNVYTLTSHFYIVKLGFTGYTRVHQ